MKFHKTSLKLTGFYLAILMVISLFFSAIVYNVSLNELERGLRRPLPHLNLPANFEISEAIRDRIIEERLEAFEAARNRIITSLLITNLLILIGGGLLSYFLALRTLKPIEEAHEAQSRFTADASHELRTPITAMRTENEVALINPKLTLKAARGQLKSNVEELEKLSVLTEGLLQLSQLENAAQDYTQVAVTKIIKTAAERAQNQAKNRVIELTNAVPDTVRVHGNEANLTEAVVILLDNALKYSEPSKPITLSATHDQSNIIISVSDQGAGIASKDLPHIFDRFYKADISRTNRGSSSYGIGLALAKSIIDTHHGGIDAKSKLGQGSVFTITLPIHSS